MDFNKKHVVITGASSGIGEAIARRFSALGAQTTLFARNENRLKQLVKELKGSQYVVGNVQKISDLEKLYAHIKSQDRPIDVLVANAGIPCHATLENVTEAMFDQVFDTNVKGAFFTVQKASPQLIKGSSVILISSIAGQLYNCGISAYSATKAAVSQLARNIGSEFVERGIRVNAVSPGFTDTPIFSEVIAKNSSFKSDMSKTLPMKRFAEAHEIAEAVVYLASPHSAYISGTDLLIDGGYRFSSTV